MTAAVYKSTVLNVMHTKRDTHNYNIKRLQMYYDGNHD